MSDETKETVSTPDTSKEEEKDTEDTSMDQDDGDTSKDKDDSMEKSDDEEESKKNDDKNDDEANNDDDDDDDEAVVESDDEPQVGSLEKPLVLEEGSKRERKKVERISFQKSEKTQEAFEVKGGKGQSLGDIPYIEHMIGKTKAEDLKPLHRLLFKRAGNLQQVKKNIRQFSGFPFSKDDNEYEKRLQNLKGKAYPLPVLKKMMDVLDVPRSGVKDDLVVRLMEWLEKPKDSGRNIPKSKRKRKSKGGDGKKKRVKKEKAKKETKKKKTTKKDEDDDDENDDDDMEDQDDDKASDASDDNDDDAAASDKDDDDVSDIEPSSDEEEDPEPPKKKARKTTPKPKEKKPKKPTKKATPAKSPAKKKATPKKKAKVSNEEVSDISSDDSDDEPLVAKKEKTKSAPTNDELKDLVKKMLDNANLEQVTMKSVLKDVFAKYPDFDLTDRKDFIKNTVKQIIS